MGKVTKITKIDPTVSFTDDWDGISSVTNVTLGSAYNFNYGTGYFNGSNYNLYSTTGALEEGTDYAYDDYLDENGDYDIYDDNTSGALDAGKYIRIVIDGTNVSTLGSGLDIVAKDLSTDQDPGENQVYIDPYKAKIIIPRPSYFCKLASLDNIADPEISTYGTPYTSKSGSFTSDTTYGLKFGNGIYQYSNRSQTHNNTWGPYTTDGTRYIYPYGTETRDCSKGTLNCWVNGQSYASGDYKYYIHDPYKYIKGFGKGLADQHIIHNDTNFAVRVYNYSKKDYMWGGSVDSAETHRIYLYVNGSNTYYTISNGGTYHLYIVWDESGGLTDNKTVRVFVNGTEQLSSTDTNLSMSNYNFKTSLRAYGYAYIFTNGYYNENITARGYGQSFLSDYKLWDHVVSEDPSWQYNSGSGRENAIHTIYGAGNDYAPNNVQVGYNYPTSSTEPAKITEANASGNYGTWSI